MSDRSELSPKEMMEYDMKEKGVNYVKNDAQAF